MRTKTPLQLMYDHERYANSFTKVSGAGTVVYMKSNKAHTYSAKTSLIKQHLERTLSKIKEIHRKEFEDEFNKRFKSVGDVINRAAEAADKNRQFYYPDTPVCKEQIAANDAVQINYSLIDGRTNKELASATIFVPSTKDRRMIDAIYRSLESKGINRKFWFRFKPLNSFCGAVELNSTYGAILKISLV